MSVNKATVSTPRLAESAVRVGVAVKKGTAPNGVVPIALVTDRPAGITLNEVLAAEITAGVNGDPQVGICVSGPCMAMAGAAVAIDDDVVVDADGDLVPKSGAGWVLGKALSSAGNGEAFTLLVNIRKEPA